MYIPAPGRTREQVVETVVSACGTSGVISWATASVKVRWSLSPEAPHVEEATAGTGSARGQQQCVVGYVRRVRERRHRARAERKERYLQRRPMLLTTNKPLAALGDVVHDGDLAEAILDRLLERGVHFALRGRSYRTRHLPEEETSARRKSA